MSFLRGLGRLRYLSTSNGLGSSPVKTETFWQKYRRTLRENPLPIWAGLLVVSILQYRRIRRRNEEQRAEGKVPVGGPAVSIYEALPLGAISRLFGAVSQVELPLWARSRIFSWYINRFGCKMDEACCNEITDYPCMSKLFSRELKEGARPIDVKSPLTMPCDGKVLSCGRIDQYGYLEQIKGMSYPLRDFIGPFLPLNFVKAAKPSNLFHVTIYLAPGDYHHFHSPTDWNVSLRRHFSGKLLSVGVWAAQIVPRLFVQNERAVYIGKWSEGFFSMIAVGATNVGSIQIEFDQALKTNTKRKFDCDELVFSKEIVVEKGQHFGLFNLGSTIVLVFEAPDNFRFDVQPGQKVLMGEALGGFGA